MFRHSLTVALLASLAAAPAAFAQEEGAPASGKRFAVVGGYALAEPDHDPGRLAGLDADVDGDGAATLSASAYLNENVAIEAWGTDAFGHRLSLDGLKAGSVSAQPYALSAQYHFGESARTVRPFVGLGYYEMNLKDEEAAPTGTLAGARIGGDTARGPIATAGVDLNFSPTWFARADVRYLHTGGVDIDVNGSKAGEAELDPVVLGVGVGARF